MRLRAALSRAGACLVALALVTSACGSSDSGDEDPQAAPTATTGATPVPTEVEATTAPTETPVAAEPTTADEASATGPGGISRPSSADERRELILGYLNGEQITEAEFTFLFSPTFVAQIGYQGFINVLGQLQAEGPWSVQETLAEGDAGATLLVSGESSAIGEVILEYAAAADGTITTLLLRPPPEPGADTIEGAIDALTAQGAVGLLSVEIGPGDCTGGEGLRADEQMPLGSVFKLYVLAAVGDAISAGNLSWDEPVEIDDRLDSLPSGVTQDDPDGSTRTVRELAERMIEISDNTATDHLIALVGRAAVEAAVVESGHSAPERNIPFPTTRELFILKLRDVAEERRLFLGGDEAERREALEAIADEPLPQLDQLARWVDPIAVTQLEWFGSPRDVCRVLAILAGDADARAILERNPGFPDEAGRWDTIGFKGGSEPGVLAAAWLTSGEGDTWVTVVDVFSETSLIDEPAAITQMAAIRDLAGT